MSKASEMKEAMQKWYDERKHGPVADIDELLRTGRIMLTISDGDSTGPAAYLCYAGKTLPLPTAIRLSKQVDIKDVILDLAMIACIWMGTDDYKDWRRFVEDMGWNTKMWNSSQAMYDMHERIAQFYHDLFGDSMTECLGVAAMAEMRLIKLRQN